MLGTNELVGKLGDTIERLISNKRTCFALSGGVDSTLLAAIAASKVPNNESIVAYTADTGHGNDLVYARAAAAAINADLKIIAIPEGDAALDFYEKLSKRAGQTLELRGNSIGFAFICEAAASDGFDAIVDGTGAEQLTAGNPRLIVDFVRIATAADRPDLVQSVFQRLHAEEVQRIEAEALKPGCRTIPEAIEKDLTNSEFLRWHGHHILTARGVNIEIIMPFLEPEMRLLAEQPLEFYYPDGWSKGSLRKPLAELVNRHVAYRIDNQGLRWPVTQMLAGCEKRMRRSVSQSGILRDEPIQTRLKFAMKRLKLLRLVPLYEASVAARYGLQRELATWET